MLRTAVIIFVAGSLCGCAAFNGSDLEETQHAALAARSKIPDQVAGTMNLTALVNRDNRSIRILNPTENAIRGAKVWVNSNFVMAVDNIPPHGSVTLDRGDFYDASGTPLTKASSTVTTVQMEENGKLHNLLGPVFE
jgi:hypothetical protein